MRRRDFIRIASVAAAAGQLPVRAQVRNSDPLVGIQIAPVSILDEGIERCLDTLQGRAGINALFVYSQTYHAGTKPKNVLATDHGVPARDFFKSRLPHLWVRHSAGAFDGLKVQHERIDSDLEYADRDIFHEISKPARNRGMKVYARILEADARRQSRIPGYENVLTIDHKGQRGHGPCWNNPHYRQWVFTTIRQLVSNYELDGLQYGAERTGPLSHVLYRGITPTCFCRHCETRNARYGIDADRARAGFTRLYQLMQARARKAAAAAKAGHPSGMKPDFHAESVLSEVMKIIYQYPEVLSWDYQWFQADEEICSEVHRIAKTLKPDIDSGRHVDHQRSSWDFFYRSAMSYEQMARDADYIKPIVYHESMGPRLRWWVLDRLKDRLLSDLTLEQSLSLYYSLFGHDSADLPGVQELDAAGLGPEYVYREINRCRQAIGQKAKIYAGIGIDIPWYVPDGMEPRFSDHEQLTSAVRRAFDAGADGVLASREYNEMRLTSLDAFGKGVD